MWINQPGKAYGPGSKGRVGMNGGARGGWSVAPSKPPAHTAGNGWSVVPVRPGGFQQVHPAAKPSVEQGLHSLVQKVNLQAALARIKQLQGKAAGAPPGPRGVAAQPGAGRLVALPGVFPSTPRQPRPVGMPFGGDMPIPRRPIDRGLGPVTMDPGMSPYGQGASLVNPAAPPWVMPQDSTDLVGPYMAQHQGPALVNPAYDPYTVDPSTMPVGPGELPDFMGQGIAAQNAARQAMIQRLLAARQQ